MFNSVEFVLMFLSMFSSVTKETIQAVTLLLHLASQYNVGNVQRVPSVDFDTYEITTSTIEPLSALAESCGYDMKKMSEKISKMEVYELLCAILEPVLGKLSPTELEEISKKGSSSGEVLKLPLDEVRTLVKMWTQYARDDEEKYGWFGTLPPLGSVGHTSASVPADTSGTFTDDDPGPESKSDQAVKRGLDEAPRSDKLERWSKMKMDAKTAAIILAYCNEYAAVPAKTTLRRNGRVAKRQVDPNATRRDTTMESGKWEMVHEVPTRGEALNFHPSSTIESTRLGFSSSGRTQGDHHNPRGRVEPGVPSNETRDWSDDGLECEWSMQLGVKQGGESSLQGLPTMELRRSQTGPKFGSPLFAISGASRNRTSPRGIPKAARRGTPVNIDDIFGVGFQETHQPRGTVPASNYDSGDVVMPTTPLKHDRSGFDGLWGGYSTGSLNQVDGQGGPGSVANDYGFGEITMPRTPLKHDRGEFDDGLWGGRSFGSLDGASFQGEPSSRPGPSGLDPNSVAGPSTSTPAPAVTANGSGNLEMPKTPLKHDRGEFDYGLWGEHSVASFNQASTSTPVVAGNSAQANTHSHRSDTEPQPHESAHDPGDIVMPRTPLKHDRGTFDHGLWGSPSARENRVTSANAIEPGSARLPGTPLNRNRGAFDYGVWAERPTMSVDEASRQEERPTSPGPVVDMSGLRPGAPMSLRRVWRRRVGVRNLRAVAVAHAAMDGMGPTTSMLNNILIVQREDNASDISNSMSEEPVNPRSALPPLAGYHERSREYHERNGGSDTSRTSSDSPSLLTPGTSSFPTPGTSPCPTLTMEYYAGVAAGWEMMQKEKWQSGLQDEQSDVVMEPKWNMMAKVVMVAGRKLRGLLWN